MAKAKTKEVTPPKTSKTTKVAKETTTEKKPRTRKPKEVKATVPEAIELIKKTAAESAKEAKKKAPIKPEDVSAASLGLTEEEKVYWVHLKNGMHHAELTRLYRQETKAGLKDAFYFLEKLKSL